MEVRALLQAYRLIGTKYEHQDDVDDACASAVLVKENRMCHRYAILNYGINRCGCVNAKTLSLKLTQRVESILGLRNAADSGLRIKLPCLRRIAARSIRPPTG